jgi:hypothetical protein
VTHTPLLAVDDVANPLGPSGCIWQLVGVAGLRAAGNRDVQAGDHRGVKETSRAAGKGPEATRRCFVKQCASIFEC